MKAGCLLLIVSIALIWGGAQGTYTGLTNLSVHEYSIQDYIKKRPDDKWIRITGGMVDLTEMSYSSSFGSVKKVYIPVVEKDAGSKAPIHILLLTEDPKLLEAAAKLRDVKSEAEAMRYAIQNKDILFAQRNVEGLIQFGIDVKEGDLMKLKSINPTLSENFVIIKEGEQPKLIVPLFMFFAGLFLMGLMIKGSFGKSATPPPPPPYPQGNPPPIPPSP